MKKKIKLLIQILVICLISINTNNLYCQLIDLTINDLNNKISNQYNPNNKSLDLFLKRFVHNLDSCNGFSNISILQYSDTIILGKFPYDDYKSFFIYLEKSNKMIYLYNYPTYKDSSNFLEYLSEIRVYDINGKIHSEFILPYFEIGKYMVEIYTHKNSKCFYKTNDFFPGDSDKKHIVISKRISDNTIIELLELLNKLEREADICDKIWKVYYGFNCPNLK